MMKNIFKVLFLTILISSCREDLITESTVIDEPIPTNTYLYEFGVFGLVVDEEGDAIDQASLLANGIPQVTDDNGYFEFEELDGSEGLRLSPRLPLVAADRRPQGTGGRTSRASYPA